MKHLFSLLIPAILSVIVSCSKEDNLEVPEVEKRIVIRAQEGISNQFGVFFGATEFAVNIPVSHDYHLKYLLETANYNKSNAREIDTVDLFFNVQDSALIYFGIDSLESIQEATLSYVDILTSSEELQGTQLSEFVTIYYGAGNSIPWDDIIQNSDSSDIILIEDGNTVPDSEVVLFEEDDLYPEEPICIGEHTLENSYNLFACQIGGGGSRTVDAGGWYWIRMSIGFENGEAEARAQKPDITLPVTMDGESLTMSDSTIVEYNDAAGFWEVNAYYCTGRLEVGTYIMVGDSYMQGEYVDRAVCMFIVE